MAKLRKRSLPGSVTLPDTATIMSTELVALLGVRRPALSEWRKSDPTIPPFYFSDVDKRRTFMLTADVIKWLEAEGVKVNVG